MPSPSVVTSLSEALNSYSAVVVTGGSSGLGKSFIELGRTLETDLVFCNLWRSAPVKNSSRQNLNHSACNGSRPAEIERAAAGAGGFPGRNVITGRILLMNNRGSKKAPR